MVEPKCWAILVALIALLVGCATAAEPPQPVAVSISAVRSADDEASVGDDEPELVPPDPPEATLTGPEVRRWRAIDRMRSAAERIEARQALADELVAARHRGHAASRGRRGLSDDDVERLERIAAAIQRQVVDEASAADFEPAMAELAPSAEHWTPTATDLALDELTRGVLPTVGAAR